MDLHVHTPFSDSLIGIDEILQHLISNGIKIVGFADHLFPGAIYSHPKDGTMEPCGLVRCYRASWWYYRKAVIDFYNRKYPEIIILNSAEVDILPHGSICMPRGLTPAFFDYLMVSKHQTLPKPFKLFKKFPHIDRWMWQHNPRWRLNRYLWQKGLYSAFERFHPQIIAHVQEGMPKYSSDEFYKRFVLNCKKYDVAIELNGGHYRKDDLIPLPVIRYAREYGVKFSLSSDFHGYMRNHKRELNLSQEVYEYALKHRLELFDVRKYVPEPLRKAKKALLTD